MSPTHMPKTGLQGFPPARRPSATRSAAVGRKVHHRNPSGDRRMALQSARNLAVKIRVFYKTDLPGSAHRATPVLRSLTSPLCRSIKEHFRSSWHGRPSARIPYPSSPSPLQHVPSRFLFLDRVRGSTDPIQSIRRPKKTHLSPPFAPSPHVVPSASELYKSGRNVPSGESLRPPYHTRRSALFLHRLHHPLLHLLH